MVAPSLIPVNSEFSIFRVIKSLLKPKTSIVAGLRSLAVKNVKSLKTSPNES